MDKNKLIRELRAEVEKLESCVGHAFLGPSFSHIGFKCAASALRSFQVEQRMQLYRDIGLEFYDLSSPSDVLRYEKVTEPQDQPARDGTALHLVFEYVLRKRIRKKPAMLKYVRNLVKDKVLSTMVGKDDYILDRLFEITQSCLDDLETADSIKIEQVCKVKGLPQFGRLDLRFTRDRTLYIKDLKCGRVVVNSKNNHQLMCYGVGILDELGWDKFDRISFEILAIQFETKEWVTTVKKLRKFKREVMLPGFLNAYAINPVATPGNHCLYCAGKIACGEWQEKFKGEITNETFDSFDPVDMSSGALVDLFKLCKQAENLCKHQLTETLLRRFEGFDDVPELTRVTGQKFLEWTEDESTVARRLKKHVGGQDKLYDQRLKTPKQLVAAVGGDSKQINKQMRKLTKQTMKRPYLRV